MRSAILGATLVGAIACGPASPAGDDDGETSTSGADDDETTSATTGSAETSTEGAAESSGAVDATSSDEGSSSTGDPFTYSADETHVELSCAETGPRVWIEIYPGELNGECLPEPDVDLDTLALIVLEPWDGASGTYEVGPDGPGRASVGLPAADDPPIGTLVLEVSAPWTLASATIELTSSTIDFAGTADLSECGPAEPADPCE